MTKKNSELYSIIRKLEDSLEKYKQGMTGTYGSPKKIPNKQAEEFKNFLKQAKGDTSERLSEEAKQDPKETTPDKNKQTESNSKNWPLENQQIIDHLREENLRLEKEMLNFKYLSTIGEQDFKRVRDKLKIAEIDVTFLKDSKFASLIA